VALCFNKIEPKTRWLSPKRPLSLVQAQKSNHLSTYYTGLTEGLVASVLDQLNQPTEAIQHAQEGVKALRRAVAVIPAIPMIWLLRCPTPPDC
jgi:hypothetical protein